MVVNVKIKNIYYWHRKSTNEWVVSATFLTENTSLSINFPSKKLNKAKKNFYKFCTEGILKEEMEYRFRNNEISIPYR